MTVETAPAVDERKVEEFAGRMFETYTASLVTFMIDIGHRTGLFDVAAEGPATSAELATRAGLHERYVREWLGSLTTAGVFSYDTHSGEYTLPAEHAACLAGDGSANVAPLSLISALLGSHVEDVARCFRDGGGVPYEMFRPGFTDVMDGLGRGTLDGQLIDGILPLAGDLSARLAAGIRVADIGCGTGHAMNLLAATYPRSTFTGYDIAADAIDKARAEAESMGLTNVEFEVRDVASLPPGRELDAVFAFDAIHDQADPVAVLRSAYTALAGGGTFFVYDIKASSHLEDNIANPLAPMLYSISTLHCMTVSLAGGGAGLGTCWGEELARQLLGDAGFEVISVNDVPDDPMNVVYVSRKP